MMPRAQEGVLTADEKRLLVIAAKLVDIMCKYAVRPPCSAPAITFWNNKVQEEMAIVNTIYAKYSQKPVRPHLHPVVQIYGAEWTNALFEGRSLCWDGLTTQAVAQACKQQWDNDAMKSWPADLSADDISSYLGEVGANYFWWRRLAAVADDPTDDVNMADSVLAGPPTTSATVTCSRSNKGKACSTSSAHLACSSKAAAGSSTSRKTRIISSELDVDNNNLFVPGDDVGDEDEEETADLMRVTVEGALPPKKHGDAPLVAIGDHRCGPCQDKNLPQCLSQKKGRVTIACLECANKKKPCSPPAVWALSLLDPSNVNNPTPTDLSLHLNRIEYKEDQNNILLHTLCERQLIDVSTIPDYNPLPHLPRSISPAAGASSSPGLGVSALALSDSHSNTSSCSSRSSQKQARTTHKSGEEPVQPARKSSRKAGDKDMA